jgi:hypothetical protein
MVLDGDPLIEQWFPDLRPGRYRVISPEDAAYNCVAWAAGRTDTWWQAVPAAGYYWPDNVPWNGRVDSLVRVFESLGFEVCDGDAPEPGYDKVALYGKGDDYEHAARQLSDGRWTSKLGAYKDIEHETLQALAGEEYGSVVKLLRKAIAPPP